MLRARECARLLVLDWVRTKQSSGSNTIGSLDRSIDRCLFLARILSWPPTMVHLLWQFSPLAILPLLAPVASSPLVVTENESVTRYTSSGEAELAILDDLQDAVSDKRELDFRSLGSHCSSPFGYGQSERNRLKSCYTDVMVAAYDADVHFAFQIASIISDAATKGSTKSPAKRLREGFNFIAQTEKGDCYNTIGLEPLCNLIVCQSTHPADVGDLARGLVADPKDGPVRTCLALLCSSNFCILDM